MTGPAAVTSLSGSELRAMFATATAWLERHVESLNAINVFPVPDGDTGTNMYLTMRSTLEEAYRVDSDRAEAMLEAMSRGALMGARGNSGVILSQIIRGLALAAREQQRLDAAGLAAGLREGAAGAYKAVSQPREGTILTVAREAAAAAEIEAHRDGRDILAVVTSAAEAARESVARTPTLLPVLAEAGVVDAGGQGFYVMLEGSLRYLRGEEEEAPVGAPVGREELEHDWLAVTSQMHAQMHAHGSGHVRLLHRVPGVGRGYARRQRSGADAGAGRFGAGGGRREPGAGARPHGRPRRRPQLLHCLRPPEPGEGGQHRGPGRAVPGHAPAADGGRGAGGHRHGGGGGRRGHGADLPQRGRHRRRARRARR